MSFKWYILHTASGSEKKVAREINEQAEKRNCKKYIEEIFVPVEKVTETQRGKKIDVEKKIFPGYILVKIDMNDEVWHFIRNIPKVANFLGMAGKPRPVSEAEVERIMARLAEGNVFSTPTSKFEAGESVRIIEGPFDSFVGLIEGVDEEKGRLKLSVSIFGRATPIELNFDQVTKINEN